MLEKLRSRHPIDLPAEKWSWNWILLAVLGGILGLFVLLPLAGGAFALVRDLDLLLAVVIAGAALVLAITIYAIRGKPGHARR